ncbi:MAG: 30S ribosomal protein S3 [Patescibacteria group bacterium]|jgi:small subunit ribosomal protein S3|nr:30S ribosomal protein S3 [Patescibacteria group bacterium]
MGHKVSPISFRLQVNKNWQSRWFSKRDYTDMLHEDIKIRNYILSELGQRAGVAKVEIERNANQVSINIHTSRPGVVIGRGGAGASELKTKLAKFTKGKIKDINILEIRKAEANAKLIADNIAAQLEKRIPFKRCIRQAIEKATKEGVKGIKVMVSGRLNGADIARSEHSIKGKIPLATLDADIDYGVARAKTTYGILGVKVWIFNGMTEKSVKKEKEEFANVDA